MARLSLGALLVCLFTTSSFAQDDRISWQGLLTDDVGHPLSGLVNLQFNFYQTKAGGTAVWTFDTTGVELLEGVAALSMGPIPRVPNFLDIDFSRPTWLGVRVNGGSELPRTVLRPVPSALTLAVPARLTSDRTDGSPVLYVVHEGSGEGLTVRANSTAISGLGTQTGIYGFGDFAGVSGISGNDNVLTALGLLGHRDPSSGRMIGVVGRTPAPDGDGVDGRSDAEVGYGNGVRGTSASPDGAGIWAENTAQTGLAGALKGLNWSPDGQAITGNAASLTGRNYGVVGLTSSGEGRGVLGRASSETGGGFGVLGISRSPEGRGVFGWTQATTGANVGVYGRSSSDSGTGVYGTGSTGVAGESSASDGIGVEGVSTNENGLSYGVHASSASSDGAGLLAENSATTGMAKAILASSPSDDAEVIRAYASSTTGWAVGVHGLSRAPEGFGVIGSAQSPDGPGVGVSGVTWGPEGIGVKGTAIGSSGINYALKGTSGSVDGFGGHFTGGTGVYGRSSRTSGNSYGLHGVSDASSGRSVYGFASSTSGTAVGVAGHSNAVSGSGGYFFGHSGVVADSEAGVGEGGRFRGGVGVYASSHLSTGADVVLGGRSSTWSDAIGILSSDPAFSESSINIESNQHVRVKLDKDGGQSDASFVIYATGDAQVFRVYEDGNVWADGTYVHTSDRNKKEAFEPVDTRRALEAVAEIPITRWRYRGDDITHLGPVAQDFRAAFGLGRDDVTIATVDADGVALAAIQGLYDLVKEQAVQIEALRAENQRIRESVDALKR